MKSEILYDHAAPCTRRPRPARGDRALHAGTAPCTRGPCPARGDRVPHAGAAPCTRGPRPARGDRVPARARPSWSPRTTTGIEPAGFSCRRAGRPLAKGTFLSRGQGSGAPSRRQRIVGHAIAWSTIRYPCHAPRPARFALVAHGSPRHCRPRPSGRTPARPRASLGQPCGSAAVSNSVGQWPCRRWGFVLRTWLEGDRASRGCG